MINFKVDLLGPRGTSVQPDLWGPREPVFNLTLGPGEPVFNLTLGPGNHMLRKIGLIC